MIVAFVNTLNLAKLIEGILATAGGFLIGYVLVAVFGWCFDKYVLKRQSPVLLHRICRLLGGLILAILVAMMVFSGGGGSGNGTGDGTGDGKASPNSGTIEPKTKPDPSLPPLKPMKTSEERVGITVLGGPDVQDNKFYLIDDDTTPRTFAEVKMVLGRKKETEAKPFGLEIRFPNRNALPKDHRAVTQLEQWALNSGLAVTFPAEAP